jgi:hypothetical protein
VPIEGVLRGPERAGRRTTREPAAAAEGGVEEDGVAEVGSAGLLSTD